MIKQHLDAEGNPLVVGKEYGLTTYDKDGNTPAHHSEWIKAIWNGSSLVDSKGCTWTEWLNPPGEISEDVYPG